MPLLERCPRCHELPEVHRFPIEIEAERIPLTYNFALPLLAAVSTTWYHAPGDATGPVNVRVFPSKRYAEILPLPRKIVSVNCA